MDPLSLLPIVFPIAILILAAIGIRFCIFAVWGRTKHFKKAMKRSHKYNDKRHANTKKRLDWYENTFAKK